MIMIYYIQDEIYILYHIYIYLHVFIYSIYLQYFFTVFIFFIFYAKNPIVISVISEVTNRAKVDI